MKTPDMDKENNFVLREGVKDAQMGYYDHLAAGGKRDPAKERWIEALEAGADAISKVHVLESRLAQVERERDAAVAELRIAEDCYNCKHNYDCKHDGNGYRNCRECGECPCSKCDSGQSQYEWRGICPENTKEDSDGKDQHAL